MTNNFISAATSVIPEPEIQTLPRMKFQQTQSTRRVENNPNIMLHE